MLSFNATIAVCKAIVSGAAAEIRGRNLLGHERGPERFAVRGAALNAINNVYYDLMTPKARDKMRDKGGREALLELAGWDDCP